MSNSYKKSGRIKVLEKIYVVFAEKPLFDC